TADLDDVVFLGHDLRQHTGGRRRDLGIDFVGGDFEQRFVDFDRVSFLLQPPGHRSLGDALTKSWHLDGDGHVLCLLCLLDGYYNRASTPADTRRGSRRSSTPPSR